MNRLLREPWEFLLRWLGKATRAAFNLHTALINVLFDLLVVLDEVN